MPRPHNDSQKKRRKKAEREGLATARPHNVSQKKRRKKAEREGLATASHSEQAEREQAAAEWMILLEQEEREDRDSADFASLKPQMEAVVNVAEDSVEAVRITSQPLVDDPIEQAEAGAAMDEIENSAAEAQQKIADARVQINSKYSLAKKYAPQTCKDALAIFESFQRRLTEGQKKLYAFKRFRAEFLQRVAAKNVAVEIIEKLNDVELEVEKAALMTKGNEKGQMPDAEIKSAEECARSSQGLVTNVMRLIDGRVLTSPPGGPMVEELGGLKKRANISKEKLDAVLSVLRTQREGLSSKQMLEQFAEKDDKGGEALKTCFMLACKHEKASNSSLKVNAKLELKNEALARQVYKLKMRECARLEGELELSAKVGELLSQKQSAEEEAEHQRSVVAMLLATPCPPPPPTIPCAMFTPWLSKPNGWTPTTATKATCKRPHTGSSSSMKPPPQKPPPQKPQGSSSQSSCAFRLG